VSGDLPGDDLGRGAGCMIGLAALAVLLIVGFVVWVTT
jgi:hypothetical protein